MNVRFLSVKFLSALVFLLLSVQLSFARKPLTQYPTRYLDGYVFLLWSDKYSDAELIPMLDRIWNSGARLLTLPVFGCQSDLTSNDVGACTVQNRNFILRIAHIAKSRGFELSFIPILTTPKWEWRGFISASDPDEWFSSYEKWIRDLLAEAKLLGVQEFMAGSEFNKMYSYEDDWSNLLKSLRKDFSGAIYLTANWDDLDHDFWDQSDAIGISTYFPLSNSSNPTFQELVDGWQKRKKEMLDFAQKRNRPIVFTELGYQSAKGAARTPWATPAGSLADPQLQADCFRAFRQAWMGDKRLLRFSVWGVEDPNAAHYAVSFDPLGKPAENVLKPFIVERLTWRKLK